MKKLFRSSSSVYLYRYTSDIALITQLLKYSLTFETSNNLNAATKTGLFGGQRAASCDAECSSTFE